MTTQRISQTHGEAPTGPTKKDAIKATCSGPQHHIWDNHSNSEHPFKTIMVTQSTAPAVTLNSVWTAWPSVMGPLLLLSRSLSAGMSTIVDNCSYTIKENTWIVWKIGILHFTPAFLSYSISRSEPVTNRPMIPILHAKGSIHTYAYK